MGFIFVISEVRVGGRLRAGVEKGDGQGLVAGGQEVRVGGQEDVPAGPLGRGHETVDRVRVPGRVHFAEVADKPVAHPGGLEDLIDVVFGLGFPGGVFDPVQKIVEFKEKAE
jgi:hypothetical protein